MNPATDLSTTPVYGVRPSKPGLYLGLFHGRDTPNQTMHGWGFDGKLNGDWTVYMVTPEECFRPPDTFRQNTRPNDLRSQAKPIPWDEDS